MEGIINYYESLQDLKNTARKFHEHMNDFGMLYRVRLRVTLQLTVSQSVCLGVEPTLWTFDQILLPFQVFGSEICCLVSVGRHP
jgi:hypothetical protein